MLSLSRENITLTDTVNNTHNDSTQLSLFDDTNNKFNNSGLRQVSSCYTVQVTCRVKHLLRHLIPPLFHTTQNGSEVSGPELPSEDSMFVHLSTVQQEIPPTSLDSQVDQHNHKIRIKLCCSSNNNQSQ